MLLRGMSVYHGQTQLPFAADEGAGPGFLFALSCPANTFNALIEFHPEPVIIVVDAHLAIGWLDLTQDFMWARIDSWTTTTNCWLCLRRL